MLQEEYLNNIKTLLADKGYDSTQIIEFIKEKYIVQILRKIVGFLLQQLEIVKNGKNLKTL